MPYHTTPWQFYDVAIGLCPVCLGRATGHLVFEDEKVWFDKRCPTHGLQRVLMDDDIAWFRRCREDFLAPGGQPNQPGAPVRHGCPYDCGLCPDHQQHTCVAVLEVTEDCNLACPVCYAGSGPHRPRHRSLPEIEGMLDGVSRSEDTLNVLQLSGGEPTLHPEFFEILKRCKRRSIRHLMVNTNGLRIAEDRVFAERLSSFKPLLEVYLQFDSLRGERLLALRGKDLRAVHDQALRTLDELDISTTLVVTLVKGVNDDEIGDIIQHALTYRCVRGVTLQPLQRAGRVAGAVAETDRLTYGRVRQLVIQQSGLFRPEDVVPVPCHSDSLAMAYAFKFGGDTIPLSTLLDPSVLVHAMDGNAMTLEQDRERARLLYEAFQARHSPSSHTAALQELLTCLPNPGCFGELTYANVFRVMIVQFMDAWNLEQRALQRSCIHIVHPDGRLIPFDTYNILHRPGRLRTPGEATPLP